MDHNRAMSRTILIVDDHAGFRASARRLLEAAGFEVVAEATDGSSGVKAAEDSRPEVALVDVGLPDFDGFEVARRIVDAGDAPRIVLISSHDRSDFGSLIETSGAEAFLSKSELSGDALEAVLR